MACSNTLFILRAGDAPPPPRCASGSIMINSVKMLQLHIHFQIFAAKINLVSQRECNLQSATIKFNTAMHMIIVMRIEKFS